MSRTTMACAFLLTFLAGAAASNQLTEWVLDKRLELVAAQLAQATEEVGVLRGSLTSAMFRDEVHRATIDSLTTEVAKSRAKWQAGRAQIPPAPPEVPGCEAWVSRCEALQGTLLAAETHIGDLTALVAQDTLTIGNLRAAVDTAHRAIGSLERRLGAIKVPITKRADPRLLLIGEVRGGEDVTGTLALGSTVLPNTTLFAGREFTANGAARWAVGARTTIRLR